MVKKRSDGEGSIYQRKDGMWIASITLPTPDGKRRRKVRASKHKAQAVKNLKDLQLELSKMGDLVTSSPTVEQWAKIWLSEVLPTRDNKAKTVDGYKATVTNYILPAIGRAKLDKLTPSHVRKVHTYVGSKGLSSTTKSQAHAVLSVMLADAVTEGLTSRNAASVVPRPQKAQHKPASLSADHARTLLMDNANDERAALRLMLALMLGLRQGESLGVTRGAVDLDAGILRIDWQLQRLKVESLPDGHEGHHLHGQYWLTRPKSKAGARMIPLIPAITKVFERRLSQLPPDPMSMLVTNLSTGGPLDPRRDNRDWVEALERSGLPKVRLHDARHTTATLLREAGVPDRVIQQILGHSTVLMTEHYAHLGDSETAQAMESLGRLLLED